jgi:hypothetical protein
MPHEKSSFTPQQRGKGSLLFILGILVIGSLISIPVGSQPSTKFFIVYGTVYDSNNVEVPNATIEIINPETGEIILDSTDENGTYSNNLANFQEGWEDEQEVIIKASSPTHNSVSIYPKEDDVAEEVNITIPSLMIVAPEENEKIKIDLGTYGIEILIIDVVNITKVDYFLNDILINSTTSKQTIYNSTTSNQTFIQLSSYNDGTFKLRVVVTPDAGLPISKEILIYFEEAEEDDDYKTTIALIGVVIVILAVLGYLAMSKSKTDSD